MVYAIHLVIVELNHFIPWSDYFKRNYQLDFTGTDFVDLLGLNKDQITSTQMRCGSKVANITRSIESFFVHKNIISDSIISGSHSDVINRFLVYNLSLSYPFHVEGRQLLYNKINTSTISLISLTT